LISIIFLVSCAQNKCYFSWDSIEKIDKGMSIQEVTKIIGEPNATIETKDRKSYFWSCEKTFCATGKQLNVLSINFIDNKVSEINIEVIHKEPASN
jgi:outer membrane protein assembly factor BamE (lipoprotein component of BamABCDE complex)